MTLTQVTLHIKVTIPFLFAAKLNATFSILCCYIVQYYTPSTPFSQATSSKFCTHLQCPPARSLFCTSLWFGCNNVWEGCEHCCESAHYADLFTVFGIDIFLSTTFPNNVTPTNRESTVGIVNRLWLTPVPFLTSIWDFSLHIFWNCSGAHSASF